jgi:hypothetical protein
MGKHRVSATLSFLLAARRCELHDLEDLARTCELVVQVGDLVHALQKERGYTNLFLRAEQSQLPSALVDLQEGSLQVEVKTRSLLNKLIGSEAQAITGKARLFNSIAYALHRLDECVDLRWRIRERRVESQQATVQFTRLIASLLAVVFEAADTALDPDVTRTLVALFNFMQGKELSGQERALGVAGYAEGYFTDEQKNRMLELADSQERSFGIFAEYAPDSVLQQWKTLESNSVPVERMRAILRQTSPENTVDKGLGELWFDIATSRIDAMHTVELMLAEGLAQLCRQRIADTREELDNHHLLMSRFTDQADSETPARLFNIQSCPIDAPLQDGLANDTARSMLDIMREQRQRMNRYDAELARARSALDERKMVEQAKWLLVQRRKLSEQAAHSLLLQTAMKNGLPLAEVARRILAEDGGKPSDA